jgi:DNA replication protein DnaC
VASLTKAEREGQLKERIRFIARNALLIVDEIGYLPVTPGRGNRKSRGVWRKPAPRMGWLA